jgi:hypothetical protein
MAFCFKDNPQFELKYLFQFNRKRVKLSAGGFTGVLTLLDHENEKPPCWI